MDLSHVSAIDLSDKYVNSESILLAASRRLYALANSTDLCNGYLVTLYDDSPTFPPTNFVARRPPRPEPTPPPPDAPTNFEPDGFRIATRNTISLVWDSAYRAGGSEVTGYTITVTPPYDAPDTVIDVGLVTAYTVGDLFSVTTYTFTLRAYNDDGAISDPTSITASTASSRGPLDPVRPGVSGIVTSSNIPLSWTTGSPGGGSAVAGYRITWNVNTNYGLEWRLHGRTGRAIN